MPKTLTETPSFDLNLVVPLGTDTMSNAAEVVEALAQKLGNRTQYLKPKADGAAQLAASNVFTGTTNTFNANVNANRIVCPLVSAIGDSGSGGGTGTLYAEYRVKTDGEFVYSTTRTRIINLSIAAGIASAAGGNGPYWNGSVSFFIPHTWQMSGTVTPGMVTVPLRLPIGATLLSADALINQDAANNIGLTIYKKAPNWTTPGAPTVTTIGTTARSAGTDWQKLSISGLTEVVANAAASYAIEIKFGPDTGPAISGANYFSALRVSISDPGPING